MKNITTSALFLFFIERAYSWQRPLEESLIQTARLMGSVLSVVVLGYIVYIIYNLLKRRHAKIKKAIFSLAPNFTLQRIANILLAVFTIATVIFRRETIESNFTLSLSIAGIIWVISVFAEYTIRSLRKKKYDKILNLRLRESFDREKGAENTI